MFWYPVTEVYNSQMSGRWGLSLWKRTLSTTVLRGLAAMTPWTQNLTELYRVVKYLHIAYGWPSVHFKPSQVTYNITYNSTVQMLSIVGLLCSLGIITRLKSVVWYRYNHPQYFHSVIGWIHNAEHTDMRGENLQKALSKFPTSFSTKIQLFFCT